MHIAKIDFRCSRMKLVVGPCRSIIFLTQIFIGFDATPIDKFVLFLHQGYNAVVSQYFLNSDPLKFAAIYVRANLKWRPRK